MSEQASTQGNPAAPPPGPAEFGTGQDSAGQPLRALGVAAVCLGVAALAAATFVLSYSGIHAVARQAGISAHYASDYPLLIDAMLVIALLAVLGLRGAGVPSRILAWLTLLAVLAAAAGADALHATGHVLPHNIGAATAAALPWALVLIAFVLLLALLRHARLRRHSSVARRQQAAPGRAAGRARPGQPVIARPEPLPVRVPKQWNSVTIVPGFNSQLASSAAAGAAAGAAAAESDAFTLGPGADAPGHDLAIDDTDREPGGAEDGALVAGGLAEPAAEAGLQQANAAGASTTDIGETNAEREDSDAVPGDARADIAETSDADQAPSDIVTDTGKTTRPLADAPTEPGGINAQLGDMLANTDETDAESGPADQEPGDAPTDAPETDAVAGDTDAAPGGALAADAGDAAADSDSDPEPGDSDREPGDSDEAAALAADGEESATGDLEPADDETGDTVADGMPVFHRMWSTPTPPDS